MADSQRRVVFFDLDGTLHQQDMFGTFMRYLLWRQPLNLLLVVPLLPVVGVGLLIKGRAARWPMSLLLWSITFGHSEAVLQRREANFARWFRQRVVAFPVVQQRLTDYLSSEDADVWLITGSPQPLVEQVYFDSAFLPRVKLIASQMTRAWGDVYLACVASVMKKWCSWRKRSVRRSSSTAAIATVSRITRCFTFASTAGVLLRMANCNSWNNLVCWPVWL